jgi:hypothetical protein
MWCFGVWLVEDGGYGLQRSSIDGSKRGKTCWKRKLTDVRQFNRFNLTVFIDEKKDYRCQNFIGKQ